MIAGMDIGGDQTKTVVFDRTGKSEVVRNARGDKSTPSCVLTMPDGTVLTGFDAVEQGLIHPGCFASDFKSSMGTKELFPGNKTAVECTADVIRGQVKLIEHQTNEALDGAVVTVPANWGDAKRMAQLESFALANVPVMQIITEPAAACLGYGIKHNMGDREVYLLCTDLGSTTFDVTVMHIKNGEAIPVATEGIAELGGRDLTAHLKQVILDKLGKSLGKRVTIDMFSAEAKLELHERSEAAKISLGTQSSTIVPVPFAGRHHAVEVTQPEFEAIARPILQRMLPCIDVAMQKANRTKAGIERLLIAGSPSLMPLVQRILEDHTGLDPKIDVDPAIVVALGAAHHAWALAHGSNRYIPHPSILLRQSTSYNIGVAVADESSGIKRIINEVIVPEGTVVPFSKIERFRLESETQSSALIQILQGAAGADISLCSVIAEIDITGLPTEKNRTARLELEISIDKNGLTHVTVIDNLGGGSGTAKFQM